MVASCQDNPLHTVVPGCFVYMVSTLDVRIKKIVKICMDSSIGSQMNDSIYICHCLIQDMLVVDITHQCIRRIGNGGNVQEPQFIKLRKFTSDDSAHFSCRSRNQNC